MSEVSTLPRGLIDETGKTHGKWTVLSYAGRGPKPRPYWLCRCQCGREFRVDAWSLRNCSRQCRYCASQKGRVAAIAASKASGATAANLQKARLPKHGHTVNHRQSRTYKTWRSMNDRCSKQGCNGYENYGGRGITVCERWRSGTPHAFDNFLADMGERPDGMTIDRFPDVNGNYEPGNCRWATPSQQSKNQRKRKKEKTHS